MSGVLDLFVPRERKFFDIFEALSTHISEGSDEFLFLIRNYDKSTLSEKQASIKCIEQIEEKCDKLTHLMATELSKTFITPFDREDIHRLSTLLDDIMDLFFNISEKLVLYNIKKLEKYVIEMAEIAHSSVIEVKPLLYAMRTKHKVLPHLDTIHEIERRMDSLRNKAFAYIFADSLKPVDVIKFKDIYQNLEGITDRVEDVADVIENIVIKNG